MYAPALLLLLEEMACLGIGKCPDPMDSLLGLRT